jgi:hypothetical protein
MRNHVKSRIPGPALAFGAAVAVFASGTASAITITPSTNANALVSALLAGANTGIQVTSATLSGQQQAIDLSGQPLGTLTSSGTYTNASGTYGIGAGVVLSTGGVEGLELQGQSLWPGYSDGPNTTDGNGWAFGTVFSTTPPDSGTPGIAATSAQEALLDPITGDPLTNTFYDHYDVTELVINFDMLPGFDSVSFNVVFGSEEYPEFVDSPFVDGFGMFLNGTNVASVGGKPVNIKHPDMTDTITGTELDGILAPDGNPLLTFSGAVNSTGNTLRFIVADTSDGVWDTTVYFSALQGVPQVPVPAAAWLLGSGLLGLLGLSARRSRMRGRME